jgi:hypothetical protein
MPNNAETENAQLFDPGMVDIITCAKVPPIFPFFGALNAKTHYAIGRAGATAVMAEEDWLQPGMIVDPARGGSVVFQPYENYTSADSTLSYDWYGVLFGGSSWSIATFQNPTIPTQTETGYSSSASGNELDALVAWWGAIPYDPRKVIPNAVAPVTATVCPA